MKVSLLGLLQSGKSTLLAGVSGRDVPPFGTTHIVEAVVPVPDERLDWLTGLYQPKKTIPATIDCLDVPGFSFLDDPGRAGARRWIDKIRTMDMLVLVVRAFEEAAVPPYRETVDPARDLAELQTELLLADLELVTTRIERLEKQVTRPTKSQAQDKAELALQRRLQAAIEAERPIRSAIETEAELALIKSLNFLTLKPMAVAVNVGETELDRTFAFPDLLDPAVPVVSVCAKLEYELSQLDSESRAAFMEDLGVQTTAASAFVNGCYQALGLVSFLTVGPDEVRAWPLPRDTIALEAAGKIHSDLKRGFIRAETFSYADLRELGSEKELKAAGKIRLEGKEYVVQDGDILNIRFNV